jgi:hypothetical protein
LTFAGTSLGTTRVTFHVRPLSRAFAILREAHSAASIPTPVEPVNGATATVFAASGGDGSQLYVATEANGDICLIDQQPQAGPPGSSSTVRTGLMIVGCSSAASAEQQGGVLIAPASGDLPAVAAALVPNGVTSVTFLQTGGSPVTLPVTNNVVWYASPTLSTVQFVAPNGQTVTDGTTPAALVPAASTTAP